jgi:hypothetical protein
MFLRAEKAVSEYRRSPVAQPSLGALIYSENQKYPANFTDLSGSPPRETKT